jgi:mevalonate kinase
MPAISASAPGKIILFGEHAVVYGRPAIAAPVMQVKAKAVVTANPKGAPGQVKIQAPEVGLDSTLEALDGGHPLAAAIHGVAAALEISRLPACTLKVTSTIPVAAGLGSGAAVSVAVIRALTSFLGHPLSDEQVCALAFEVEKIHHGTPSGIDNTVITYARPVYFVKDHPSETLAVGALFTLVIADTGIVSPTKETVGDVRKAWQAKKDHFEALFDSVAGLVDSARHMIAIGQLESLGMLMDANHGVLGKMGVSSPELDRLAVAARRAGALGAKLSGGGRGGNLIALARPKTAETIAAALRAAGAARTMVTEIKP